VRVLAVSRSGYYAARGRAEAKVCPVSVLQAAFARSGRCYGSRRLQAALRGEGIKLGRYRVRGLMRAHGLRATWKRKFIHTTDSRHSLPTADNVLDRQFQPAGPTRPGCPTSPTAHAQRLAVPGRGDGPLLAQDRRLGHGADDACRTGVFGASDGHHPAQPIPGLIVHSDRGSQYASEAHRRLLERHGLRASMSRKGNCWDNAVMERFFLNLKMERVWQRDYANHAEATRDVTEYIVGFYNNVRLHSKLGYLSPTAYERDMAEKHPIGVSENT
jgi:transposase InsO family protein